MVRMMSGNGKADLPPGETGAANVTPIHQGRKPRAVGADVVSIASSDDEPAIVVFGRDESKKAHASSFPAVDAELAERAAALMGYLVLRLTTPEHRAAASGLAQGRIFASGRAFCPFAKEAAYKVITAFPEAYQPPAPVEPQPEPLIDVTGTPQRWEDIGVGALVLATVGEPAAGWFESVVIEDRGEGLLVLRWRDFADHPPFVRRVDGLALLPG